MLRRLVLTTAVVAAVGVTSAAAAALAPEFVGQVPSQGAPGRAPFVAGTVCLAHTGTDQLDAMFAAEPGGVIGADYQRATTLPNGNVLWTFQDAEVRLPDGRRTLVHNIGMMQVGACFSVLMSGTMSDPQPWLFPQETTPFSHWYWPLDAAVGSDGRVHVFAAEMYERGPGYLTRVEPTTTAVASIDISSWNVVAERPATNSGNSLYGWSVAHDDRWTYLYAQCHRQFGFDPFFTVFAHDQSCSNIVTVGRVPVGQIFAQPTYWTGSGWSTNPQLAVPVIDPTGRFASATDVVRHNNRWVAVTKVDDWFGDQIFIEEASRAVGPFHRIATLTAVPKCPVDCNTYYASWIPTANANVMMFGLSNNRWDGIATEVYRPRYVTVAAPAYQMSPADRCALGYCG